MLTRAKMRDGLAERTGLKPAVIAHVLDKLEDMIREELTQQGEVMFRGLFRVVPVRRTYVSQPWSGDAEPHNIHRIILTIRPVRSLRKSLSQVLRMG